MEHAERGAVALEASDGLTAAAYYTKALIEHPTSPDYFTQRSTALARLKPPRHDLALRDAEYAVLLGRKRQKREKIQAAQQRRVVSLYGLGKYDEAKDILESMLRWRPKDSKKDKMEHDMWMARITSKLKGKGVDREVAETVKEYPDIDLPNEKAMKLWLENQLKKDGTFKFEGEEDTTVSKPLATATSKKEQLHSVEDQSRPDAGSARAETTAIPQSDDQQPKKIQLVRHDWYQDNNYVTITFYAKKVDKTKLQFDATSDTFEMTFPHPDAIDETFSFNLDPTFASIDDANSTAKATGAKVEVKLAKREKGIKWPALDDKNRPKIDKLPSAWTTKGEQDWDKKAAELTKKEPKKGKAKDGEGDPDSDADSDFGGDPVDGFFKKLYAGADEDTRRAMMKSFQESNGTALSTNWAEVGKGKVEEVKGKEG